jgi:hypothetical protein
MVSWSEVVFDSVAINASLKTEIRGQRSAIGKRKKVSAES